MSQWPSTKARLVLAALLRIGWTIKRQSATSHRILSRIGWPDFTFAFHDKEEIGSRMLARFAKKTGILSDGITYSDSLDLPHDAIIALYGAVGWSAAERPVDLLAALRNSASVVTAWDGDRLIGLGNAISDGHLVVYYPHLLVHPEYQRRGIGSNILARLKERFAGLHQHMVVADGGAVGFYRRAGFETAGQTQSLWIYAGREH